MGATPPQAARRAGWNGCATRSRLAPRVAREPIVTLISLSLIKAELNVGKQVTGVVISGGPGGAGVADEYRAGKRAPAELSLPIHELQPGADLFSMWAGIR